MDCVFVIGTTACPPPKNLPVQSLHLLYLLHLLLDPLLHLLVLLHYLLALVHLLPQLLVLLLPAIAGCLDSALFLWRREDVRLIGSESRRGLSRLRLLRAGF